MVSTINYACVFIQEKKGVLQEPLAASCPSVLQARKDPHLGASSAVVGPGVVHVTALVLKGTRKHPEMVMTMFCYLYAVFFACLLKRGARVSAADLTSPF